MGFAGGFTLGVVQAGFELVGKRELQGGFGVANCEVNRHLLGSRWQTEVGHESSWTPVDTELVFGNPPCSGFSVMSAKTFRGADSKINHCMWAFVEYAARVRPQVAAFESVQQAYTSADGRVLMTSLRDRLDELTGWHWNLHHVLHNAYSVGGAAQRRRYFWVASRVPFGVEEPDPHTRLPLLRDVIGDLAQLGQTWLPQPYRASADPWVEPRRRTDGAVDGHVSLDIPLTRRIRQLLDAVDWKPGEALGDVLSRYWDEYGRLPNGFDEEKIVKNEFHVGYTTPTRWNGNNPARVITGGALQMVVHPWLDRTITHREAARVMGFPDDWLIEPLRGKSGLHLTWGKGITVDCGRWLGGWIKRALDGQRGSVAGKLVGNREWTIDVTNSYRKFMW